MALTVWCVIAIIGSGSHGLECSFIASGVAMSSVASTDLAGKVQRKQQEDARELLERLESVQPADVTVNYTLEKSSATLPGILVRFVVLAVLFRLNSPKKWRVVLDKYLLPEPLRAWLGIAELDELAEKATVDWMPPRVFLDMLSWRAAECLTQCGGPQPAVVIRQVIRDLLFGRAKVSEGGVVLDRRFWRRFVGRGSTLDT